MKDILALYVLVNLLAYGGAVGTIYKGIQDGSYVCEQEMSGSWLYSFIGIAGFMLENTPYLMEEIVDYCEGQPNNQPL